MQISEINIIPIKPRDGLVAFASCVINEAIFLGSIAIMTKLSGSYRLVYPTKKTASKNINIFHPINSEAGQKLEKEIINKYQEVMKTNDVRYRQAGNSTAYVHHS